MDSFELNKIVAAILACAFVVLSLAFTAENIFAIHKPTNEGYALEGSTKTEYTTTAKAEIKAESTDEMMAEMELAHGTKVAKKCAACHTFEPNGKSKVGPPLYDIVNRPIGSVETFKYSKAMQEFAQGKTWTYEQLNQFVFKPKNLIKGTSMAFAGVKKTEDRAALLLYLRSLSQNPAPLPEIKTEQ